MCSSDLYSRINQHVYPRDLYKKMRTFFEEKHQMSFEELFTKYRLVGTGPHLRSGLGDHLISDFNLLGKAAHFLEDGQLMTQVDLGAGESWPKICVSQCNSRLYSLSCCDMFRDEQIAIAQQGGKPEAHMDCNNFAPGHACSCEKNGKKRNRRAQVVRKIQQNQEMPPEEKKTWEDCITSTNTQGVKCGQDGYCYGSAIENTCEKVQHWIDSQADSSIYPKCACR